jgi:hypothetical protein
MARFRSFAVKASGSVGAAGGNSSDYVNRGARGISVFVKNTAGSGTTPTVTVKLQAKSATGDYYDVPSATTAAIAGGTPATTYFTVYPGVAETANVSVSDTLPAIYRLVWTIGGSSTPTVTFSVDAHELA